MDFKHYWDEIHKVYSGQLVYDDWLRFYKSILDSCKTKVLDLGSGGGHDASFLIMQGLKVVAVDYSKVSLEIIKKEVPKAEVLMVDISEPLPFQDESFDLVVADLSLHYFDDETIKGIMYEIKRILTFGGHLIARVNSTKDTNHGAGKGEKIEDNFYFVDGCFKRVFNI